MSKREELKALARDKFYLNTTMVINDNNYIELDNIKKVLEYNDICLKVKTSNLIISIWGSNICINDYGCNCVVVKGNFDNIEFTKK